MTSVDGRQSSQTWESAMQTSERLKNSKCQYSNLELGMIGNAQPVKAAKCILDVCPVR